MALPDPWHEFALDPRRPEHAGLRAADADRDVVLGVLGEAFAQGRLDREEYDERSDLAHGARTLGELPGLVQDLVLPAPMPSPDGTRLPVHTVGHDDVHAAAVRRWERARREAFMGWIVPTLITWVVWSVTMFGGFPWPAIVTAATSVPLIGVMVGRQDMIAHNQERILRKRARRARKAIERGHDPRELG
jgi:hypothetical protein